MKENIEEVVARLEKSINDVWFSTTYSQEDEERDLQALISDYKRLQEEFKQVDHECERLEQKELRLEKEVELAKEVLKKQCDIADERNQLLIENQKLQKENEELKSDNLEYQRTQDIFDERKYRKKYLEERRAEQPKLLYPDADEIYERYYKLKEENEEWQRAYQEEKDTQFELVRENQKLKSENEELKKERDAIYSDYQDLGKEKWEADEAILFLTERLENYIPVQKIQDKIEEYSKIEKEMHENKNHSNDINKIYKYSVEEDKAKYGKLVLQDLLEEKGE